MQCKKGLGLNHDQMGIWVVCQDTFKLLYVLLYSQWWMHSCFQFWLGKSWTRCPLNFEKYKTIAFSHCTFQSCKITWQKFLISFCIGFDMYMQVSLWRKQMSFHLKSLYKICFNWLCLLADRLAKLHLRIVAFQFGTGDWRGVLICRQT